VIGLNLPGTWESVILSKIDMMTSDGFFNLLIANFPYEPTEGQKSLLYHLSRFIFTNKPNPLFVLKGYAGTGKTPLSVRWSSVYPSSINKLFYWHQPEELPKFCHPTQVNRHLPFIKKYIFLRLGMMDL
jgi:hypothetical protein